VRRKRKRGASACQPEPHVLRLVHRSLSAGGSLGEGGWRRRVLLCGLLQRFERSGVEEKRHDAYECDAATVCPGIFVGIAGHDDLSEVIPYVTEREGLLFALFVVGDVPCGLDGACGSDITRIPDCIITALSSIPSAHE